MRDAAPYTFRDQSAILMKAIRHSITLDLNVTGYGGSDLDAVVPAFITERHTKLTLLWASSAEGPESFRLIVEIAAGIAAGSFVKTFVQELSKDLYEWSKEKLRPMFGSKTQSTGEVRIEFDHISVSYRSSGGKDLAAFFRKLPDLLDSSDISDAEEWRVTFDASEENWTIEPVRFGQ